MPLTDVPTIEAVKLTKRYGSFEAVSDLNIKIEGAKCVGFLGPNGAGKTTTPKDVHGFDSSYFRRGFDKRHKRPHQ